MTLFWMSLFSPITFTLQLLAPPLCKGMLLPQLFVALFIYLTLIDAFCYYSFCFMLNVFNLKLICARNRAGWAVYPYGLLPTLCNSNMLDHINLLNLKFLMFLYFHQHAKNFCYLMLFFFPLLHLCYDSSHNNAWIHHKTPGKAPAC